MTMEKIETHTSQLLCDLTDGVATVTLNQPKKRNALSDEMTPALRAIIPILDARKDVRCVVITGAGDGFCSGGGGCPPFGARVPLRSMLSGHHQSRGRERRAGSHPRPSGRIPVACRSRHCGIGRWLLMSKCDDAACHVGPPAAVSAE